MQSSRLKQGVAYVSVIFGVTSMGATVEIRRRLRCRSHCQRRNCVERPRRHVRPASRTSNGGLRAHDTRFRYLAAATSPLRPLRCLSPQKPAARPPPNPARSPPASSRRTSGGTETQHPQDVRLRHRLGGRCSMSITLSPLPRINARRPRRSSSVSADRSGRVSSGACFSSFSGACFSMSWISLI